VGGVEEAEGGRKSLGQRVEFGRRGIVTAYLLLAALAWAVASGGGTAARDLIVVFALLVGAVIVGRAWPRGDVALWAAFTALVSWLVVAGLLRTGLTLESARVPVLVVIAALTILVARQMNATQRDALVRGLIVIGCFQAIIALAELTGIAQVEPSAFRRTDALLGSPNGLGILLVASSVLTAREFDRRGGWLPVAALLLQGCALLSTGSRTAILVASVLLIVYVASRAGWKRGILAASGLVIGAAVVIRRTLTEQEDRPQLWLEALRRIADSPLLGEGPASVPFALPTPSARITTHAHNELLQWGVEYGLIGIGLGLVVLVLAFRSVRQPFGGDRWIQFAAFALLAAGLTDFTLRITALTLAAAALVTLAVTGYRPDPSPEDLPIRTATR
jgi:O-antigen ligase